MAADTSILQNARERVKKLSDYWNENTAQNEAALGTMASSSGIMAAILTSNPVLLILSVIIFDHYYGQMAEPGPG